MPLFGLVQATAMKCKRGLLKFSEFDFKQTTTKSTIIFSISIDSAFERLFRRIALRRHRANTARLQNKAAKIILDRPLYSSASDALTTLKWLALEKRRFQRRCVHVYKCLYGLTHHELTLVTQQEQHSYNTRNKANLKIPSVKRNWGKQRTGYHAVNDFNSLETIRASDNVNILKRQIFNSLI